MVRHLHTHPQTLTFTILGKIHLLKRCNCNQVGAHMNMAEAMKYKREIQNSCSIEMKMLDTAEDGLVLCVDRKTIDNGDFKMIFHNF